MADERAQLREKLTRASDARAVATRQRLHLAFRQVAATGTSDINVSELSRLAEVGRSTFYTHYATIGELAVDVIGGMFVEVASKDIKLRTETQKLTSDIARESMHALVQRFAQESALIRFATGLPEGALVHDKLVAGLTQTSIGVIQTAAQNLDPVQTRIVSEFLAAGTVHVLTRWVEDGESLDPAQVVESLVMVLPALLTGDFT